MKEGFLRRIARVYTPKQSGTHAYFIVHIMIALISIVNIKNAIMRGEISTSALLVPAVMLIILVVLSVRQYERIDTGVPRYSGELSMLVPLGINILLISAQIAYWIIV